MSEAGVLRKNQIERSERIVKAAMQMAKDGGYDAVHMRELAELSDVAMGTIYRYFGSKDDVLLSGMAYWVRLLNDRIRENGFVGASVADRVVHVLQECSRSTDREPGLMRALLRAMGSGDAVQPQSRQEVSSMVHDLVVDAIGGEAGVDAEGVARVIGHVWFAATISWVGGRHPAGYVGAELERAARLLLE